MSFESELRARLKGIFDAEWKVRNGAVVPDSDSVALGNDVVKLDATVLYADLEDSTQMVRQRQKRFSTKIYKAYLDTACRVIRYNNGTITAFDGDRVMAVYIGKSKNTSAVKSGLGIAWAVSVINEEIKKKWSTDFSVHQTVGIDTSEVWVAKTGIRGSNDLVWVGTAANFAAKLTTLGDGTHTTWITEAVHSNMHESVHVNLRKDKNLWVKDTWVQQPTPVYKTSWYRGVG